MKTKVIYAYCDASNYKFEGFFIVSGHLEFADVKVYLFDGEFFVPHEVGLEHLLNLPTNSDDHYFHTFMGFEETNSGMSICTADELIERFRVASQKGWLHSFCVECR